MSAQPIFNTTWKIITHASFVLGLPREKDPHSPVVRTCHPAPLSSPRTAFSHQGKDLATSSRPCYQAGVIPLPLRVVVSTSSALQHAGPYQPHVMTWQSSQSSVHTYKFCENMWLDKDFMSSSFHWAERGDWEIHVGKYLFALSCFRLLAATATEETCPDPVLTPVLTPSLVPIHAKPQHRLSWLEVIVVGLNSTHSGCCTSDCADPRWGQQIKAAEKLRCPIQIYRSAFLHTIAGRTPVCFC